MRTERKQGGLRRRRMAAKRRRICLGIGFCLCCYGAGFFIGRMFGSVAAAALPQTIAETTLAREQKKDAAQKKGGEEAQTQGKGGEEAQTQGKDEEGAQTPEGNGKDTQTPAAREALRESARELQTANAGTMMLVNREREFDTADALKLRTICQGRLQAADLLYDDLCEMLAAASEEGHRFWIASAYRSRQRQQQLVNEDAAKLRQRGMSRQEALETVYQETMPAGHSEHETGLALDILAASDPNMGQGQEDTPENQWLQQHCYEYGFIIRYPVGKEDVTGVNYEPWHLRYVGKRAAAFLRDNDLTLEEFYELLE